MALSQADKACFERALARAKPYTEEDYPKKGEEYDINRLLATVSKRILDANRQNR